jgi:hypothetical protein
LIASPIWSGDIAGGRVPAAGEMRTFRRQLVLDADVDAATCVVTCDNGYDLFVNGKKIGSGDNWADPQNFDLSVALLKGANQIVVVGRNAGAGPNVAALFFQVNVTLKGGARVKMATDASWEWTTSMPNARGAFAAGKGKPKAAEPVWQPVALVKGEAWRKAQARMAEMLAGVEGTSSLPARGRPREVRPPAARARPSEPRADRLDASQRAQHPRSHRPFQRPGPHEPPRRRRRQAEAPRLGLARGIRALALPLVAQPRARARRTQGRRGARRRRFLRARHRGPPLGRLHAP